MVLAVYCLKDAAGKLYFGPAGEISLSQLPHYIALAFDKDQYGLPVFANLILLAIPVCILGALLVYRQRGPVLIMLVPVLHHADCGPACRTGIKANSATTGSASGSGTTCSRRRSPIRRPAN